MDKNLTAVITENIDTKNFSPDKLSLIFDIDVFKQVNLNPDDPAISRIMEDLRNFKNEIFLNSLTDRAKELFR